MRTLFAVFIVLFSCQSAAYAMSIGKEGSPRYIEGVAWQPMRYDDHHFGFTALFPGHVSSGCASGNIYAASVHEGVIFEIHLAHNKGYRPPSFEKSFFSQVVGAFGEHADIYPIQSKQNVVRYIVEIHFRDEPKVVRLFCSNNQLYWAIIEGDDLSLAPQFFDSILITK